MLEQEYGIWPCRMSFPPRPTAIAENESVSIKSTWMLYRSKAALYRIRAEVHGFDVGFDLNFKDSTLFSWVWCWIRPYLHGFDLGFMDSTLVSWVRHSLHGFDRSFMDSNSFVNLTLDSALLAWVRPEFHGFDLSLMASMLYLTLLVWIQPEFHGFEFNLSTIIK